MYGTSVLEYVYVLWCLDTRSRRCHIPEDGILHSHGRENFYSYIISDFLDIVYHPVFI
jgi:hypothetical protein